MRADQLDNLRVVLDALWRDLPGQIGELGSQLDFIAFTGDVAHSGKAGEYQLAKEHFFEPLLEHTMLPREQLFIVPGNHDVDWDATLLFGPNTALSLTDRDKVTALLNEEVKRRVLFAPMTRYAQFIQRFFGDSSSRRLLRDPLYSYVQLVISEPLLVSLIGLNSAWLSGFTRGARGNVTDRGNLLIGDKQIGDAIREARDVDVRIALMHHPPSWLKEFDERDVEKWLQAGCDFVLRGHLHHPDFVIEKALGGDTITIPAGTVYSGREWLNGYNLVRLDLDAGRGEITLRRYSEERREWVKDVQSTGDSLDGLVRFDLPGPLGEPVHSRKGPSLSLPSPSSSLASQVLSKIRPHWLRVGRERDTQLLETFLQRQREGGDTLWIWGDDDCGLMEFLQIVRALLRHEDAHIVQFDAEYAASGMAVDQHHFLDGLEEWAGTRAESFSGQIGDDTDERWNRFIAGAEDCLAESDRRLVLIFANYHLLPPAIRAWVLGTLWGEMLQPLKQYGTLAVFACEGSAPACPARDKSSKIYLEELTVEDIERFLLTQPINPERVPGLARQIHSESTDEFLARPRCVYPNLVVQLMHLGALPALDLDTDTGLERDSVVSILEGKIETGDFDVFLCHNSEDTAAVKEIGQRLKAHGILPWLDEWELQPGLPWQRLLEKQIEQIKSAAVFVGKEGMGPWQQAELEAFLREFVSRGCPVIPVLLPGTSKKPRLPVFLRGMTWVDFRKKEPDPTKQLIWGITGRRDWII
jgi:predicted phosphodiesterase